MARYAAQTTVPAAQTRAEIEQLLEKYSASRYSTGCEPGRAVIMFEMRNRRIRLDLPLPQPDDKSFLRTPTGLPRTENSRRDAYGQEMRRRWRALLLVIKAKLEATATGITTFDQEWLAFVMTDSGQTIGEMLIPQLDAPGIGQLLLPPAQEPRR